MRVAAMVLVLVAMTLAGCADSDPPSPEGRDGASDNEGASPALQIIDWDGYVAHAALDGLAHMKDPETVLFPVQQAGFLVEIDPAPQAIEVMVSWDDPEAGFRLHPHYTARYDEQPGGETLYYGYRSDMFDASPGCVRVPQADMAAGTWPMMIHPADGTMDVEYTITVGIVDATGVVLDERHGHRSDGPSPVEDHGVDPCRLLMGAG